MCGRAGHGCPNLRYMEAGAEREVTQFSVQEIHRLLKETESLLHQRGQLGALGSKSEVNISKAVSCGWPG